MVIYNKLWHGITAYCAAAFMSVAALGQPINSATMPYVNMSFGIDMRVPAGWTYDRSGFFGPGSSLGLLRGVAADGRHTLQILVFRELRNQSFADWIEYFSNQLGAISGTISVQVQGVDDVEHPTAFVSAEAQGGIDLTVTTYYCVQFDEQTILVVSYSEAKRQLGGETTASSTDLDIPEGFVALTKTLRIFYNSETAEVLASALQRGKQYLAKFGLQKDVDDLRLDGTTQFYELIVNGQSVGYTTRRFAFEDEPLQRPGRFTNAKAGLRSREITYRFDPDGAVHYSQVDLFSSRDSETDLYEISYIFLPAVLGAGAKVFRTRDQCIREGDTLFSTFTTSDDAVLPEPRRPIKLKSGYLGLAWARLLPALLGPEQKELTAFTIYDADSRTLVTHACRAVGEKTLQGGLVQVYEVREGFAEKPSYYYTNETGEMVRFEADGVTLKLVDEARINKLYGKRREQANERLLRSQQP